MKLVLAFVLGAAALVTLMPSEAEAWYCRASSPTGSWGWGSSYSLSQARRIALNQCAIRTPRGYWCRLRYCT